jgi:hypothetical protein
MRSIYVAVAAMLLALEAPGLLLAAAFSGCFVRRRHTDD